MSTSNRTLAGAARYLTTSSAQTSFSLQPGRTAHSGSSGSPFPAPAAHHRVEGMGGYRGLILTPFGTGADNATFELKVWRVRRGLGADNRVTDWELSLFGFATCTLGTAVGVAGGVVVAAEKFCDTVVWATAPGARPYLGAGSALETAFGPGPAGADSPANHTAGRILIPDLFDAWGVLIEFDLTGATAANCLIEQTR